MPLDAQILSGIGPLRHVFWDVLALGASLLFLLFAAGGPVMLHLKGARRLAYGLGAGLFVSGTAAVFFQLLLQRPRPPAHLFDVLSQLPGFPSGHASLAFAAAVFLGLHSRRSAWWLIGGALVVAASRVYLGHHYPSDVLAGACLGSGLGALVYGLFLPRSERPRWAWFLWPSVGVVAFALLAAYGNLLHLRWIATYGLDKPLHFILFGALAFFGAPWVQRYKKSAWAALFVAAASEEFYQALVPVRTFDLGDLACTLGGIVLGGLAAQFILHRRIPPVVDGSTNIPVEDGRSSHPNSSGAANGSLSAPS